MKKNGISIQSTYSPEREAERFILQQKIKQGKYLFLVIGAGQGFLISMLTRMYPGSKILSFYLDDDLLYGAGSPEKSWYPGFPFSLVRFLSNEIEDCFIPLLTLIQWDPCRKAYPDEFNAVMMAIGQYINERNASIVTTVNFGEIWIRNAFLNFLKTDHIVTLQNINQPVVITAAGPTLTEALPSISTYRNNFFLLALPSSLMALQNSGIIPDLIVNTDPGFWNMYHFMRYPYKNVPVAMPLTGSIHKGANPVLLLNQRSVLEDSLCSTYTLPVINLPQNGTVAGTALFLASQITSAPVIFSGLDLSYDDINEHVTPHAFHTLLETRQYRLTPFLSLLFKRKFDQYNQKRAFHTYETWFNSTQFKKNIYRLNPSSIQLESFKNIDNKTFYRILQPFKINYQNHFTSFHYTLEFRKKTLKTVLKHFLTEIQNKKHEITDFKTLDSFIFFLKSNPAVYELLELTEFQNLIQAIKTIASNDILRQKDITDIFLKLETYLGRFHA